MREIKFKAWDKKNNRRVNVDSIEFVDAAEGRTGINVYVEGNRNSYWLEEFKDEYELLEYSGMKDRNGIEIYEGDIIKYDLPAQNDRQEDNVEYTEEVKFIDGCFECDNVPLYAPAKDWGCEVIGNIYENPKLLK